MGFYTRVGERLRALRNQAGLSQAALGARIGRSASAIDRYEMGQRRISLADLVRLAKILEVAPETLLQGPPDREGSARAARARTARGVSQPLSPSRLQAEHLRLLRELDRRLAYPPAAPRSDVVREQPGTYRGGRIAGRRISQEGISPEVYAATLSAEQLRALARRAGWPGAADPKVLRRFAALVVGEFARSRGREGR